MRAHRGLTAGETDAVDAVTLDAQTRHVFQFLETEHLGLGQPLHPLGGHAVGATEVATVRHRDAQVADGATERIDEIADPRVVVRAPNLAHGFRLRAG